jgi:hypothetical protein
VWKPTPVRPARSASRDEHATAQTALIGRSTGAAGEHERVVFGAARSVGAQHRG